jgi:hypothetical protein
MSGVVDFRTILEDENGNPINAFNPLPTTGGGGGGGGGSPLDAYALNDLGGTDPLYIGKVRSDGVWIVQNYSTAAGTMRYANLSNNQGYPSYASAWAARATLTYGMFQTLTGV